MGNKNAKTGTTTTNTSSTSAPPPYIQQADLNLVQGAQAVASQPFTPYPGQFVAPINAQQNQAISNINSTAQGGYQGFIQGATNLANAGAQGVTPIGYSGEQINKYLSPYTQDVVNATQAQFNNQNAQDQQRLKSNTIGSGNAFGGDRAGVASGILSGQENLAQAPVIAGLNNTGFNNAQGEFNTQQGVDLQAQELSRQNQAQGAYTFGALGNENTSLGLSTAGAQLQAGTLEQATTQNTEAADYQQFLQALGFPFQELGFQAGIDASAAASAGGTSNSSSVSTGSQPVNNAGSALGAVAGLGGALGQTGAFGSGGWLSGIGTSLLALAARGGPIKRRAAGGPMGSEGVGGAVMPYMTKGGLSLPMLPLMRGNSIPGMPNNQQIQPPHQQQTNGAPTGMAGLQAAFKGINQSGLFDNRGDEGVDLGSRSNPGAVGLEASDFDSGPGVFHRGGVPGRAPGGMIGGSDPIGGAPGAPMASPNIETFTPDQFKAIAGLGDGSGVQYSVPFNQTPTTPFDTGHKPGTPFVSAGQAEGVSDAQGRVAPPDVGGGASANGVNASVITDKDGNPIGGKPVAPVFGRDGGGGGGSSGQKRGGVVGYDDGGYVGGAASDANYDMSYLLDKAAWAGAKRGGVVGRDPGGPVTDDSVADLPLDDSDINMASDSSTPGPGITPASHGVAPLPPPKNVATPRVAQPVSTPTPATMRPPVTPASGGVSPQDFDYLVRTVWGEARGESPVGQQGVAAVAMNRARASGMSPTGVVLAKGQFEPWSTHANDLLALDRNSPEYKAIAANILPVVTGQAPDPTGGATYFYSPKAQAALGREAPGWANGKELTIGNHNFYYGDYNGSPSGGNSLPVKVNKNGVVPADAGSGAGVSSAGSTPPNPPGALNVGNGVIGDPNGFHFNANSPWGALTALGAGMLSSKSNTFGGALGAGLQGAQGYLNNVQNQQLQRAGIQSNINYRNATIGQNQERIDIEGKKLQLELMQLQRQLAAGSAVSGALGGPGGPSPSGGDQPAAITAPAAPDISRPPPPVNVQAVPAALPPKGGTQPAQPAAGTQTAQAGQGAPAIRPVVTTSTGAQIPASPAASGVQGSVMGVQRPMAPNQNDAAFWQSVDQGENPYKLNQAAAQAAAVGNTQLATTLLTKADSIFQRPDGSVMVNGRKTLMPGFMENKTAVEGAQKQVEGQVKQDFEQSGATLNDLREGQQQFNDRQIVENRARSLMGYLESYQTGMGAEQFADIQRFFRGIGVDLPNTARMNSALFQEFSKSAVANVFGDVKAIGGQVRVAEIAGLTKANANADLTPEANAAILSKGMAAATQADDYHKALTAQIKQNPGLAKDVASLNQWKTQWLESHQIDAYESAISRNLAPRGSSYDYTGYGNATQFPDASQRTVGHKYMTQAGPRWWAGKGWARTAPNGG